MENKINKEKKNIYVVIAICVLIFLIIGGILIVYCLNNKSKVNEPDIQESSNKNNKEESDIEVQYRKIKNDLNKRLEEDSIAKELAKIATFDCYIGKIDFSKDNMLIKELSDYVIANFAAKEFGEANCKKEIDGYTYEQCWTKEIVESAFKKVFGNTIKPFNDGQTHGLGYVYTVDGLVYQLGVGDICGDFSTSILDFQKENDEYSFDLHIFFPDGSSDLKPSDLIANYRAKFKKDTEGNYYFYSIEKIKVTDDSKMINEIEKDSDNNYKQISINFEVMKEFLHNQIKNNNKNAYIVKCKNIVKEDAPPTREEKFIKVNESTIDIVINKLKEADKYEQFVGGYESCPPKNIMYYVGGETYYSDKQLILDYAYTENALLVGYFAEDENKGGYKFIFNNENILDFIESLEIIEE